MHILPINIEEEPAKIKHICYFIDYQSHKEISLMEVVEEWFPHPEAPEHAFVQRMTTKKIVTVNQSDNLASSFELLNHAQINIDNLKAEEIDASKRKTTR